MEPEPARGQRPFLAGRLAAAPELRQRVEAAEKLGISLRRFDGWEPTTTTEYEYDLESGRLVRSVTIREAEWDDEQQGWMLALAEYRESRCQRCGGDVHETTDPANQGTYKPKLPIRCHRCDGLLQSEEAYATAERPQALIHLVEHKPRRG